eukprot:jgi/Ulvmu1/9295/UM050_0044.1
MRVSSNSTISGRCAQLACRPVKASGTCRRNVSRCIAARDVGVELTTVPESSFAYYDTAQGVLDSVDDEQLDVAHMRKTKIVATIGPTSNSQEAIIELGDKGLNVARLNMSHGDHDSHQEVVEKIRNYNDLNRGCVAILLDTKGPEVRSGDLNEPAELVSGEEWTFTITEGEKGVGRRISVNYDGFVHDVSVGDELLVDGGIMTFEIKTITDTDVVCSVVDGGTMGSRRHLNIRGKSANLPAITERDWKDIDFGIRMGVDFYALSFVRDAACIYELQAYLKRHGSTAQVLAKIESADAVECLDSILDAVDGAMVARGDLGAELPVECVPFWQSAIVQGCRKRGKPVIVATNMLESMIQNPAPTRAEVSDISIAVREGTDAVMLSGETAYGEHPLKSMQTMSIVAKRTEFSMTKYQGQRRFGTEHALPISWISQESRARVNETFAYHTTTMANTLGIPVLVFTATGNMPALLSHYRPNSQIFAFTDNEVVRRRMALYHAVTALKCDFSQGSDSIINNALLELKVRSLLMKDDEILVVQSSKNSIWGFPCPHAMMLYQIP